MEKPCRKCLNVYLYLEYEKLFGGQLEMLLNCVLKPRSYLIH